MAESAYDYDQYTHPGGRLFSSAMFGFNKGEVLEYLDELANENIKYQQEARLQIEELKRTIDALQAGQAPQAPVDDATVDITAQEGLAEALEVARAATQQAEDELAQARMQLEAARHDVSRLSEENRLLETQKRAALDELGQRADEAAQTQADDALAEQVASLEEENQKLAQANEALAEQVEALKAAEEQYAATGRQLVETETQLQQSVAQLAEKDVCIETMQAQVDSLLQELKQAREAAVQEPHVPVARPGPVWEAVPGVAQRTPRANGPDGLGHGVEQLRADVAAVERSMGLMLAEVQNALDGLLAGEANAQPPLRAGPGPKTQVPVPAYAGGNGRSSFRRIWPDETVQQGDGPKVAAPLHGQRTRALADSLVDILVEMIDG